MHGYNYCHIIDMKSNAWEKDVKQTIMHIAYLSHDIIITHTCCYILWHMIVHEIRSKGNLHKEVYEFEQDNNREKFQNATTEI